MRYISNIILREYQKECIDTILEQPPGSYLVQLMTGGGKTVIFSHIPRRGRVLVLAHREELIRQAAKYYDCPVGFEIQKETSAGEEVVVASVQSLVRRLDRFPADTFDMMITDECFPAGTLIDGKPIEQIAVDDMVTAYNHDTGRTEKRRVTHIFKRPAPDKMVKINDCLICTPNHPVYAVNKGRYINAEKITAGDCLLCRVRENALLERPNEKPKKRIPRPQVRESVLLERMRQGLSPSHFLGDNEAHEPEIRVGLFRAHESQQPYEPTGSPGESDGILTPYRTTQAESEGRKRERIDRAASLFDGTACNSGTCRGIRRQNRRKKKQQPELLSAVLQNRHCDSGAYVGNRDRREKPRHDCQTGTGREESGFLKVCRVESVEIFQQGSNGESGGVCADGYVYNLEVDGLNNYFANGVLVHNCHHAPSRTYRTIYNHFTPRLHLGFTATVTRGDKVRLDDIFQKIIFQRDLRWGIQNGYLTDILCKRVNIGYDLSAVHSRMGDYAPGELEQAMDGTADAIAQAYREHAKGPTIIFAVSVRHADEIAAKIPGAVVVTAKTKNRASIIQAFTDGKISVIVNCMVFTEGTDIPCIETCIVARPTQSESLFTQMVGRALRPYPGKEKAILIDCVGVTGKTSLCTAPSLLGIDMKNVPVKAQEKIEGMLFELPQKILDATDCPESWIKNIEIVDLWAKGQGYNLHNLNVFRLPDGSMTISIPGQHFIIPAPDLLGNVKCKDGSRMSLQDAIDTVYKYLTKNHSDTQYIWDLTQAKRWGKAPASEKQIKQIQKLCKGFDTSNLTKLQASQILNRIYSQQKIQG